MSARYVQPLRILIQSGYLMFMIWLGFCLYNFVQSASFGSKESIVARSDGIECFLPISGLLGFASWVKNGEINSVHPAAVIVFVTAILCALLLRRSFCSWVCPIATISEWLWKGGFQMFRRNIRFPKWLDNAIRSLKYLLMCFFVYSIAIAMTPDALTRFIQSDYHKIADIRLMNFFLHISTLALTIVLVLILLSVALRSPFCRYLCPYGALLGLVAIFSPLRVVRNTERCVSCGVCSQVCPTYIDVMHKSSVSSPECIACWRCISHCRFNEALSMRAVHIFAMSGFVFAILVVVLIWGGPMIGKLSDHWHSSITLEEYVRLLAK